MHPELVRRFHPPIRDEAARRYGLDPEALTELAAAFASGFALERRCLRIVEHEQGRLNQRLGRASLPLTSADLAVFTRPRNGPPLAAMLADGLGVSALSDAASTVLRYGERSLTFTD